MESASSGRPVYQPIYFTPAVNYPSISAIEIIPEQKGQRILRHLACICLAAYLRVCKAWRHRSGEVSRWNRPGGRVADVFILTIPLSGLQFLCFFNEPVRDPAVFVALLSSPGTSPGNK